MDRLEHVKPSATVGLVDKVRELTKAGVKVISLGIGDLMVDSPPEAKSALEMALEKGETHYVSSQGIPELREAIVEKLRWENSIQAEPENVIVTPGAKYALYLGVMAMVNPGDEVIVTDPSWKTYEAIIYMAGAKPVYLPVFEKDQFRPVIKEIEKKISKKTRMVMVNTPCNPTGAVLLKEDVEGLAELAQRHDLYVMSDEVYEKFVFDGLRNWSIASLPGMKDRTLTINGFSKGWAMTGWRIGYGVANKEVVKRMTTMQEHSVTCTCAFTQRAGIAALKKSGDFVKNLIAESVKKRDLVVDTLNRIPGISCASPRGTFYAFSNITRTGKTDEELSLWILDKTGVITIPGSTFGEAGKGYLRVSYAIPWDQLKEGLGKVEEAVKSLPK